MVLNSKVARSSKKILVIRPNSGLSGDMLVTGLAQLAGLTKNDLDKLLVQLNLPHLTGRVRLVTRSHQSIRGYGLDLDLPEEHEHRHLADITQFFEAADMTPLARELTLESFRLLAEAEAFVHGQTPQEVHFHEVGAMDSLLDMGLSSILFDLLNPDLFVCGPLPLCDGVIKAAHGLLPAPAPAVAYLLSGVRVTGLNSAGETVTPTALSLLKTFGAVFGNWPEMVIETQALVYGSRFLPDVPNGALFAWGLSSDGEETLEDKTK
ncbi:MAG: LarC family nickel insertion protein [Deltaproteobacteria bacterium]|jgi:uncharacterized protein (DUF111 family)|nr:LarC family nickel insertion protein [Deltaproteobacteria bacterium]